MKPQHGTAITEVTVALLALAPFLLGIPLLGKQLDIKHKSLDAARYAVWERTVWRSSGTHHKDSSEIALEASDRALGDPRAAIVSSNTLRTAGLTENRLWRDFANQRLLDYTLAAAPLRLQERSYREPVAIGSLLVPAFTYGGGAIAAAASVLRVSELGMARHTFAEADAAIAIRPLLQTRARTHVSLRRTPSDGTAEPPLMQQAAAAILSDTWSAHDETEFRRRVDALTVDEFVATVEVPSRVLALNALGKGEPLFGEGQYAWAAQLQPSSAVLPRAYVERER